MVLNINMDEQQKENIKELETYSKLVQACKYLEQLVQLELRGGTPSKQRIDEIQNFLRVVNE